MGFKGIGAADGQPRPDPLEEALDLLLGEGYRNVRFLAAAGDPQYDGGRTAEMVWVCQTIPLYGTTDAPYAWGLTRTGAARALYGSIREDLISRIPPLTLHLTDHWRRTLADLLSWATTSPPGSRMIESFDPSSVWGGDLERFGASISHPVVGTAAAMPGGEPGEEPLDLSPAEVHVLRKLLEAMSECWAGGAPWPRLVAEDRDPAVDVLARLSPRP